MKFALARTVAGAMRKAAGYLSPVSSRGGWWPIVNEPYTGAWQRNDELTCETVVESPSLFACITLIAGDVAKLRARLVELQTWGGWTPTESPSFSPVLRKPNRYQNHIQFKEHWLISKLTRGNTYVLKERDARQVVVRLYVLDPLRVTPLIAPDGAVYYELATDNLNGLPESVRVPASEVIHDRFNCLFHPLVGLSPIFAAGLPALQSLKISRHWSKFFGNNAQPGGILAAPGPISPENATEIKATWQANYTGINAGRVAVVGDGMKYQPLSPSALDSQVIQQLQWGAETIAAVFHIPAYKINVGAVPSNNNVEALDSQYYTQCLQKLLEDFEACMDEGLGIGEAAGKIDGRILGVDLDLKGLLRMDTAAKIKAAADAIKAGFMAPNEARAQFDLPPVAGGETPYLQVQNYSLAALDERDESNPLATPPAPPAPAPAAPAPAPAPDDAEAAAAEEARAFIEAIRKGFELA
jgi:HK97 family phage portal protein